MADGYFMRGEIYWVRMDNGFGGEQGVGRPGVILTADDANNKQATVTIAFMSTKYHATQNYIPVEATGQTSYVIVNQIMTYDKTRLGKYMGRLSVAEQKDVDDMLEQIFDLGYVDDVALKAKDKEIAERDGVIGVLRAEAAGTAATIQKKDDEIASLKMEIEMWQKCYGRCMDMLVDTKVNADLSRRVVEPKKPVEDTKPVEEKPVDPPAEPPKQPEEPRLVDANSATFNQLRGIGMPNGLILTVIKKRPYAKLEDLKNIPGMNAQKYNIYSKKMCCVPVATPKSALVEEDPGYEVEEPVAEVRKVNINAASAKEISEITGVHVRTCSSICGYRAKNGPYKQIDDLLKVNGVWPGTIEKCKNKIEFGECAVEKPVEKPEPPVVGGKINVNTASAREIQDFTGLQITACYAITGKRKRDGLFKSLDELVIPGRLSEEVLAKYRDKMEV